MQKKFFLYMAFTVVHSPNEAPAESIARYDMPCLLVDLLPI